MNDSARANNNTAEGTAEALLGLTLISIYLGVIGLFLTFNTTGGTHIAGIAILIAWLPLAALGYRPFLNK